MTPDEEIDFLRQRVYQLTYRETVLRRHGDHCLIPTPNIDPYCPVCVANGWLEHLEPALTIDRKDA